MNVNSSYQKDGHGIAHDGRRFNPRIPAGATVSWRRLAEPRFVEELQREVSHVLAVWDRFDEMGLRDEHLQQTARGPCVAFYTDADSIEDLLESAVPAPSWVDSDVPSEVAMAQCVLAGRTQFESECMGRDEPNPDNDRNWLRMAVWTYRMLSGCWPILGLRLSQVGVDRASSTEVRRETNRVFGAIQAQLDEQLNQRWWESPQNKRF